MNRKTISPESRRARLLSVAAAAQLAAVALFSPEAGGHNEYDKAIQIEVCDTEMSGGPEVVVISEEDFSPELGHNKDLSTC